MKTSKKLWHMERGLSSWFRTHVFLSVGITLTALFVLGWHSTQAVTYSPLNSMRPKDHAIIRKDGVWHVFSIYCLIGNPNCQNVVPGLMHLTSTDLKNWTEVGYVLPPPGGGAWDTDDIWAPSVVERDGTYYLFYTGVDKNASNALVQKIGLATSTDLYNWTKYGSGPVLDCANFTWGVYYNPSDSSDGPACRDPYVTWDESEHQWLMLLSTRTTASTPANLMTVAIATSEDLVTWREYGRIPTADDYTTESAHLIQHGGTNYIFFTDNCSTQPCVKYVSSTSLYSGYSAQVGVPTLENNAYASEYIVDRGREYLTRVDGNNNYRFSFSEITWSGSPLTIQDISYGTIGDAVWADTDGDGLYDAGESGVNNVALTLYLDNGDGLFNASTDYVYRTATTGDDPNTVGTQTGYYRFQYVIPDTYWVAIDPSNYGSGGALAGTVATTSTTTNVVVSNNQAVASVDMGFRSMTNTWPLTTPANFDLNSEATLVSGRATTTEASGPTWWDKNYKYRRAITVSAGTEALTTAYTMNLGYSLSALVSAGKLQSDYDDLRLVYWNGSAHVPMNLDIIDSDTQRFKIQASISPSATDSNYYLYYGHPGAVRRPTYLASVYDYYQSFNSKDQTTYGSWQEQSDTNWAISNNKWRYNATTGADRFSRDTSKQVDLRDDWNAEASVTINSGESGGLAFHDLNSMLGDAYYMNANASTDIMQFWHYQFGKVGTDQTGVTLGTATEYKMRFEHQYVSSAACILRGYVDDVLSLLKSESGCGGDIFYPGNTYNAYFALNTYNANVSYNDLKGWQTSDGSSVSVSSTETPLQSPATGTVTPLTGQAVTFSRLTGFQASTLDQGGTVGFVVSNDGGSSWQYYNGSAWASSNGTIGQSNTASEINTQAATLTTGAGQFTWRALLVAASATRPTLLQVGASYNIGPSAPTLMTPAGGATTVTQPTLTFSVTDPESESLQYQIQLDTTADFNSSQLQTITQSALQLGWTGQNAVNSTRYDSGSTATYTPLTPLARGTWYWRARAIDPSGSNVFSSYSATGSFVLPAQLIILNPTLKLADSTTAVVTWTTSNAATGRVDYGTSASYGSSISDSGYSTSHEVTLSGLTPNSTYHVRVSGTDTQNQIAVSADLSIQASQLTVSSLSVVTPTDEMAIIRWSTNEATSATVDLGLTTSYGRRLSQTTAATQHQIVVDGLKAGRQYHYRVTNIGSSTAVQPDATFTMPALGSGRPVKPQLSSLRLLKGLQPKLRIAGVARGGLRLDMFVDGQRVGTTKMPGSSGRNYAFARTIPLRDFTHGRHRVYVRTVNSAGYSSLASTTLLFRF